MDTTINIQAQLFMVGNQTSSIILFTHVVLDTIGIIITTGDNQRQSRYLLQDRVVVDLSVY
ncbi:MAG: hypothetical protein GY814_16645 [Gammaproteobacteria bacterium]|nr:hypothetical protein [Gammaproteobacteria bacterium]